MKFLRCSYAVILFTFISLSFIWIYCTEPVEPELSAPSFEDGGQVHTIGTAVEGTSFSMYVSVTGTEPFSFQWLKDGSPISSEHRARVNDTLNINPLSVAYNGTYLCIATNSSGSDSSKTYTLTVATQPVIDSQPKPQSVIEGDSACFSISASGTFPLSFQWQKDSIDIAGAIDSGYTIDTAKMADSGCVYRCIVSNIAGSDTSIGACLSVNKKAVAPSITIQPQPQSVSEGQTATFNVSASGTAPLSYQWQKDNTNITGATDTTYTTSVTTMSDSGSVFRCIVSNSAGADTSEEALLEVSQNSVAPTITTQPQLQSITEGQTATFSVAATGTAPLSYQWQKDSTNITGATSNSYSTPATTLSDSGSLFRCIVTNAVGVDTSDNAMLLVNTNPVAPTITTQPVEQTVTEGQTASFTITATGTTPLTFQWQKGNTDISGATNPSYTTPATALVDSGSVFRCIVSNSAGVDTSDNALLKVSRDIVAPTITTQPVLQSVKEGQMATFSVRAAGTAPITFQWQKDDVDIAGATDSNYTTPATTLSDSGLLFRCIVSNPAGVDTSDKALLQVSVNPIAPTITTQPTQQSVTEGEPATFTVSATGTAPLSYQWQKGGVDVSGATNSSYTTPATALADSGLVFRCIVNNIAGADTSDNALLIVNSMPVKPTITTQPKPNTVLLGETATFSLIATGTSPLSFQWQKDEVDIPGATNPSYPTPAVTKLDDGAVYRCIVSNSIGKDTSDNATLSVHWAPEITTQPVSQTVEAGNLVTISVTASGNPNVLTYQWKKNGVNISGATSNSHTITSVQVADAGSYTVDVTNVVSTVTSDAAILTIHTAPTISTHPSSQTIVEGNLATFSVIADGNPIPTYQWKKDNVDIAGATNSTYQIASVQESDADNYTVDVTNVVATVTSNIAVLTVHTAPSISTHPASQTIVKDNPVTFTVVADGIPAPAYQWKKDNSDIPGATSSSYTIASVQTSNAGAYTVDVSNAVSTITSNAAILTVHTAPSISTHPSNETIIEGNPVTLSVLATGNPAPDYQWKKNNVNIPGANSNTYQISSSDRNDAGSYTVVVSNVVSSITSNVAVLTIHYAPEITDNPDPATQRVGDTITFSVTAAGVPSPSYQWKLDGSNITGATGDSYTINSIEPVNGGNYTVTVTNSIGNVTSTQAALSVTMEYRDRRDGTIYPVVQINNQIWMARNLNYEPTVGDSMDHSCYNNMSTYCDEFGRLYSWEIATAVNPAVQVCPPGWHLPSKSEFDALISYAGGTSVAGGKLKAGGSDWDGTDNYGFKALPGGENYYGSYFYITEKAYFWTSTAYGTEQAYTLYLNISDNTGDYSLPYHKSEDPDTGYFYRIGCSIRCIKD